jgi:cytochrome c oxidase subunit 2
VRDEFQDLFAIYAPIGAAVFAVVLLAYILIVVRFRRRPGATGPETEPPQPSDRWRWEVAYAVGLAAIAAVIITFSLRAADRVDALSDDPGLTIDVTAFKWQWAFTYRDEGLRITGVEGEYPTLTVPTDTTVRFTLRSNDVIHSFWVPAVRFKRDAFPDRTTEFDLTFDEAGRHEGICAEFCGLDHTIMRFEVDALPPDEFQRWLAQQKAAS